MLISNPNIDFTNREINLVSSKSESNRALIIKSLCSEGISINNLSDSDDTKTLISLLNSFRKNNHLDAHHAGTTFRFMVAFLSIQKGEWILTGSDRMKERPIGVLVDTLNENGACIKYLEREGYPPLRITGSQPNLSNIEIDGSISSQYISALLLIAPVLNKPTKITFTNKITSRPYIEMTLDIMQYFGAKTQWKNNEIIIQNNGYSSDNITIESDWSAASYWYQIVALSEKSSIEIKELTQKSFQGDSEVAEIFNLLGVSTSYKNGGIQISKSDKLFSKKIELNLNNTPDLAQTIICTCAGLGVEAVISGLETLIIKETNRLEALKSELNKFNIELNIINNQKLHLKGGQKMQTPSIPIETYNDHRMAMAFAPLCISTGPIEINNPEVVSKSYPNFWEDLKSVGFAIQN